MDGGNVWLDVPFSKQEKNLCGAACLYMIMEYWRTHQSNAGERVSLVPTPTPEEISASLYSAEAKGIYGSHMASYLGRHGFRAFIFKGSWADLENHLSKGRPLIIALEARPGGPKHYAVVAGLDSSQKSVFLNDPARRKLGKIDQSDFLEAWRKTSNWTLLAVPQSES
jgi:ABC-type bacteriocin/lantibiotic exporter with double-glycine peptidase domain